MKTIEEHKAKVREIAEYAFAHAINQIGKEGVMALNEGDGQAERRRDFFIKVHDGFKLAQKLLIEETLYYQALLRSKTEELKEARHQKDKVLEKETANIIAVVNQRLSTLNHIADGIAWQLIGGQIHVARRLYIKDTSQKFLDSSNLEHAIQTANETNKEPEAFALLSDLTGFVQIGDLIVARKGSVTLMELKEGAVNRQVNEYLAGVKDESVLDESDLQKRFKPDTAKQIKRVVRQKQRGKRAVDVITNDKGIDPATGKNITVHTPTISTVGYHDELEKLYLQLSKKNWAYSVVDNCLHIGMYKGNPIPMSRFIIKELLAAQTENHLIIDWLTITRNVSQPLFLKPFDREFVIDMLTGGVKVIMGIHFDELIALFNSLGLKTRWLSRKETAKKEQDSFRKGMFKVKGKGIEVTLTNGHHLLLDGGVISKILYDNITPSNMALTLLHLYDNEHDRENDSQENG